ncbi:hypothetical protein ACKFKF_12850 [Phormidesmis sp. 146-12]
MLVTDSALLKHLVKVSEDGFIANAVSLDMMANHQQNIDLCRGFVFNYNPEKPKESTLGILEVLRRSYHSPNEPNIHLMVQDFGKGKSHFALTIANFFKQPFESEEVQGILARIGDAVSGKSRAPLESLTTYKQRSKPHLVVCISGERVGDLKQAFLRALRETLEAEGITDTIAQQLVSAPLQYLKGLTAEKRTKADAYLVSQNFDGDISSVIGLLENDDYQQISIVKEMSRAIEGFPIDFNADLDVESSLEELLTKLCKGSNARFEGILILFDELNAYLRGSSANAAFLKSQIAIQNITNICERHKTYIALLCFSQVRPSGDQQASFSDRKNYERYTTRVEQATSTYEPKASLELVLDNLILEISKSTWQVFQDRWDGALLGESQTTYERFITAYTPRNFPFTDFHRHLTMGCFPLHPLTTYLLCNLGFAQGRTVVQFIHKEVREFINSEPIELNGVLNFLHPHRLIDFFGDDNLTQHSVYPEYRKAYDEIVGSAAPEELIVLKALFLYYVAGDLLKKGNNTEKQDRISHNDLLAVLAGFSKSKIKSILDKLCHEAQVIYHNTGIQTYRFYSGKGLLELKRLVEDKTVRFLDGKTLRLDEVVEECGRNSKTYLGGQTVTADRFIAENRLLAEDWQFGWKVISLDELPRTLESQRLLHDSDKRGLLLQVVAETEQELQDLRKQAVQLLQKSSFSHRLVIAIPRRGVKSIARLLVVRYQLTHLDPGEKREYDQAFQQYLQQLEDDISKSLKEVVQDSTLHSIVSEKIPLSDRNKPHTIVSMLLADLYHSAPTVDGKDTMKSTSTAGRQIISFAAKRLLSNDLKPQTLPNRSYENLLNPVIVKLWGLLKATSQSYIVQPPTQDKIRTAWDKISDLTDLEDRDEKRVEIAKIWQALSDAPYGYNELSFTILFAGWLAFHRSEVSLHGGFGIPQKRTEQVSIKSASLKEWSLETNILDKPGDFVSKWILQNGTRPQLIRRKPLEINVPDSVEYEQAQQYLQNLDSVLQANTLEIAKQEEIRRKVEQLIKGIAAVEEWLQPIAHAENCLKAPQLESLIQIFSQLSAQYKQEFRSGLTAVCLSQALRDRQVQVQRKVGESIAQLVSDLSDQVTQFKTAEECSVYRTQVRASINALQQASNLPSHLMEMLEIANKKAEDWLARVQERQQLEDHLMQVQVLAHNLESDATQQEYLITKVKIEALAQALPAIMSEESYTQTLQQIDQDYRALNQKIDIWSEESIGLDSTKCLAKIQEVIGQKRRFTEPESLQKVEELIKRLEVKVHQGQRLDDSHQILQSALFPAKSALQRIRDLEIGKLNYILQAYDALQAIALPGVDTTVDITEYQTQLTQLKQSSTNVITEKFDAVYSRQLRRLEEYDDLNVQLDQYIALLTAYPAFSEVVTRLQETAKALIQQNQNLKFQAEEQRKRDQDDQRIQAIRDKYKASKTNTVVFLEEGINAIQSLQPQLHNPEVNHSELAQILHSLQQKLNSHHAKLQENRNRLASITTSQELNQVQEELTDLVSIFKESSQEKTCQALQQQTTELKKDFQRLYDLETRSKNLSAVTAIQQALEAIEAEQVKFHNLPSFQPQIAALRENLQQQIQRYADQLEALRLRLINTVTSKAADALRDELLKKDSHYAGGELEQNYQALLEEVNQLVALLRVGESIRRINTIGDCRKNRDRLLRWQEACPNLTEYLLNQAQSLRALLESSEQTLRQKQVSNAESGLRELESQAFEMYRSESESKRLDSATRLLNKIEAYRNEFLEYLTIDQQNSLERIQGSCTEEQEKDSANEIILKFQQLSRPRREEVYKKLAQYLTYLTEDFNG